LRSVRNSGLPATLDQTWQEAGGAGLPHDDVDGVALAADLGVPVLQV
jgi:hypothetical protein